jgi:murein DD-endopeptidase / murein LD-carboxypeptidase
MKKLLFVTVALSVFTVTSFTTTAQIRASFRNDNPSISNTDVYPSNLPVVNTSQKINLPLEKSSISSNAIATEECNTLQFKFSQILNRDVETITDLNLFGFIEDWWGTRYRYGGTSRNGIDCSSYTGKLILETYGITLPRTAHEQYAVCSRVNRMDLQEGDLVFFNTRGGVSHVGVYISDGYFTHSSSSKGVTISNLDEAYYSRKFIGGGKINEKLEKIETPSLTTED